VPGDHDPRTDELLEPATYAGDLHAVLTVLREEAPVAWNSTAGFWAVSRHADVVAVSTDPARFCSSRGILVEEIGRTYDSPPTMMHTDPPEHTRYRSLVRPGFTPSVTRGLEPLVRERARALLDALVDHAHQGPVDVVAGLAVPFPIQVIATLLGLPEGEEDRLFAWSEAAVSGASELDDDERMGLLGEMTVELLALAADRRTEPRDDVTSMLAAVHDDGDALSDDELGMFLIQLLVAGNETTRNALTGGLDALCRFPDQKQRLVDDPSLWDTATDEIIRFVSPVLSFCRTVTRDHSFGGVDLRAGEKVFMLYQSANRDEDVFDEPDQLRVDRDPNPHVAFGIGTHYCLGANLARAEVRVVFEELFRRLSDIHVTPGVSPARGDSSLVLALERLPVEFTPEQGAAT
jgi:cytochrome P450